MFVIDHRPVEHDDWSDDFINTQLRMVHTTLEPLFSNTIIREILKTTNYEYN